MSSPETTDILMRLQCTTRPDHALVHEAADEIERLREREANLMRALQGLTADFGLAAMALKKAESEALERAAKIVFEASES